MPSKKYEELTLQITLRPKQDLPAKSQEKLWQNLIDTTFRTSIGVSKTDHIVAGRLGESHISFNTGTTEIVVHDSGVVSIEDETLSRASCRRIERIIDSILRMIGQTSRKPIDMQVSASIHTVLASKTAAKFLFSNVRFSPTRAFKKIFGDARMRSFILQASQTLSILFIAPSHIDFIYFGMTSTRPNRKAFLNNLFTTFTKYLESLGRRI